MSAQTINIKIVGISFMIFLFSSIKLNAQDISYDKKIGKEAHDEIVSTVGLYHHPFETYLAQIGKRLELNIENKQFNYQFYILDMKEPNAMALPGGSVYFSRGILPLANSEAELAGVLGHEIIHAHKRHSIKAMRKGIFPAILQIPGEIINVVISPQLGNLINTPIKYTGELFSSNYSRKNEKEADKFGVALSAKSGYEPLALVKMLNKLEKIAKLSSDEEAKFSFFDSHPMTAKRESDIQKRVKKLEVADVNPIIKDQNVFLKKLDGISLSGNPAHGVFQNHVFLHPDMGFVIEFPKDWLTSNSPEMVGAVDSTKSAQLFMGVKAEQKKPSIYAEETKKELPLDDIVLINDKKIKINGNEGYIISMGSKEAEEKMIIHMLWLNMGKYTFQILAAGDESYNEVLKKSVLSIRPITKKEKKSVKATVLRIVEAKENETLTSLSERTKNVLNLEYLSIINELEVSTKLSKGQLIKIGKEETYPE